MLHASNQFFAQQIQKAKDTVARGEQRLLRCITQLAVHYMLLTQPDSKKKKKKGEEEEEEAVVNLQIKGMVFFRNDSEEKESEVLGCPCREGIMKRGSIVLNKKGS